MELKELFLILQEKKIYLSLREDDLAIRFPKGEVIDQNLLSIIKQFKTNIIKLLKTDSNFIQIPKAEINKSYPLTASQGRLWLLSQMDGGSAAYSIPAAVRLEGYMDINKFEISFRRLIGRHEILRTSFKTNSEEEVRQFIIPNEDINFKISREDFSMKEDQDQLVSDYLEELNKKIFDLEQGLLVRASLIKLKEENYIFFLSMHHIISDGWSMELLISEVVKTYNSLVGGKEVHLPELRIQYKDYAVWLNEELQREKYQKAEVFWLKQFAGELPVLHLPSFKARPLLQTYSGDKITYEFSKVFLEKLKAFSKEQDATLFVTLMTAVKVLLYRYSGQNDLILGTPIAGREHPDLENQIGLYINTLAIRTRFEERNSFKELLSRVRQTLFGAYEHQSYPFDKLVSKLNLKRDMSRSALFDVLVVLQNQAQVESLRNEETLLGLQVTNYDFINRTSQFDISFNFIELENLVLTVNYNTDIYDVTLIGNMLIHFENLVTKMIEQSETNIEEIDYLTEQEKHELLVNFNDTKVDYPKDKTIIDLFEEQVKKTPDNVAIIFEDRFLTYQELDEHSNQLASYLRSVYDIQVNDLIGIKLERSEYMIVAMLGILKSGAAYVPIDPTYPEERITYIENDSKSKIVVDEKKLSKFKKVQHKYSKSNIEKLGRPNDLAYVIYTSGTTGNPKGVMIEQRNTVELINWSILEFSSSGFEVMYATTSYCFDLSIYEIFYTLSIGKKIRILQNALEIKNYLNIDNSIGLNTVPSVVRGLIESNISFNNISFINMAGEIVPVDIVKKLQSQKIEIRNLYGPSEDTTYSTSYKAIDIEYGNFPIGKPISNTQIYILDESLQLLPISVEGGLYVSGAGVARGYLNKPELTEEKFISNPFIEGERMYDTGDLARWLPDGNIEFLGRKDYQVKIRGFRIELGEIENTILQFSDVLKQVVVEVKEINNDKVLVAYFVSTLIIDKSQLRSFIETKLPDYMIPSFYVELEELPLTPNGKIDRKVLPSVDGEDLIRNEYVAPRTKEEKLIVSVWEDILKRGSISIKDSFYNLGGDSIKTIQVVSRLKQKGYTLKANQILRNPILEDLAKLVESNTIAIDQSEVKGSVVLTPIQKYFFENDTIVNKSHYNQSVLL
ncbi:amino acid adenylation domain-containing protein, partial [Flavobacterium sp. ZB4P13]|uniref:non-ribosomal peptide synthetase n=1 Tax=Flavobacterium sp. ZB4P13 TaxID=3401728 RepID=UPI003AAFC68D